MPAVEVFGNRIMHFKWVRSNSTVIVDNLVYVTTVPVEYRRKEFFKLPLLSAAFMLFNERTDPALVSGYRRYV